MFRVIVIIVFTLLMLGACSPERTTGNGGGASETVATVVTSAIAIKVTVKGEVPFSMEATVCGDRYSAIDTEAVHLKRVMTGPADEWDITPLAAGKYIVTVSSPVTDSAVLFACTVSDSPGNGHVPQEKKLAPCGTVEGTLTVRKPDSTVVLAVDGTVCLKGTFFSVATGNDGRYILEGVPQGTYDIEAKTSVRIYTKSNTEVRSVSVSGNASSTADITLVETY